ncbi:SDR family oxidoreductase [uncultured Pseudoteredinibacter sp.]|uniref:SDR family NAD(P)-dependent oxidoreductase n=1 Tax=uncultured Pseudoteredinibacter sp. TaxID=1641701 RepID=UPI00261FAC94|nr:SDR family oxidoreductase [uncultured Pseudoteredinibacter sp.]
MKLNDKIIVITGAANGIGKALAQRFAQESPKRLVLADIDGDSLNAICQDLPMAEAKVCDIGTEEGVQELVNSTLSKHGHIDLFCGNAGILRLGGVNTSESDFQKVWDINVQSHIWAARAALPSMLERGSGYFLITASAAGLLTQLGSLSYSVSKHAALSIAEWLAVTHGHQGIKVSALCPQAVESNMTAGTDGSVAGIDGMLPAETVADCVLEGIDSEEFLILPHPNVKQYFQNKANDYGRWLGGMQKLQQQFAALMPENVLDGSQDLK